MNEMFKWYIYYINNFESFQITGNALTSLHTELRRAHVGGGMRYSNNKTFVLLLCNSCAPDLLWIGHEDLAQDLLTLQNTFRSPLDKFVFRLCNVFVSCMETILEVHVVGDGEGDSESNVEDDEAMLEPAQIKQEVQEGEDEDEDEDEEMESPGANRLSFCMKSE